MPTVLRVRSLVFRMHGPPREHPPPHVHVEQRGEGYAIVRLPDGEREPWITRAGGFSDRQLDEILRLVAAHIVYLRAHWRRLHGD